MRIRDAIEAKWYAWDDNQRNNQVTRDANTAAISKLDEILVSKGILTDNDIDKVIEAIKESE